jgi:zinc ribbon protein
VSATLVCSGCGTPHADTERFCPHCGMPLVHAPEVAAAAPPPTAAQERARKVQARYADGPLVRVAAARHQAEGEFLQGLLLEEGIPSMLRRSGGFDVPDFLADGPRDVLVPQSAAIAAREALGTTAPPAGAGALPRRGTAAPWVRALAVALAVLVIATVAAGVIAAITP